MSWFTNEINCKIGGTLRIPYGSYTIDEPLYVRSNVLIDPGTTITTNNQAINMLPNSCWGSSSGWHNVIKKGGSNLFNIKGSYIDIKGFLSQEIESTSGYTFLIDTSIARDTIKIKDITTFDSVGLVADDGQPGGVVVGLQVKDVKARKLRGRASYLTRCYAYTSLIRCTADFVGTSNLSLANTAAWTIVNSQGLLLDYVDVTGNGATANMTSQLGFNLVNCDATTITHCMADTVGSHGIYLNGCRNTDVSILKSGLVGGYPLVLVGGCINTNISLALLSGRNGLPNNIGATPIYSDGSNYNTSIHNLNLDRFMAPYTTQSFPGVFVGRVSQT